MIPKSIFNSIIKEKACHLLKQCAPDENSSSEHIQTSTYPTPVIGYFTNPRQTFSIDTQKAKANQSSFYELLAELEEAISTHYIQTNAIIVNRDDKIPNIKTMNLAPNDIENRLAKPDLRLDAVRDLKLIDQFMVAFVASDPVSLLVSPKDRNYLESSTLLLSEVSLQKISEAREKLQAEKEKNSTKISYNYWGLEM